MHESWKNALLNPATAWCNSEWFRKRNRGLCRDNQIWIGPTDIYSCVVVYRHCTTVGAGFSSSIQDQDVCSLVSLWGKPINQVLLNTALLICL